MTNRLHDTEIWTKDWFIDLNVKQKLLVKFLFDNCDCAGFYKISWNLLKFYFSGETITKDDFLKIKQVRFIDDDLVFVEDFALFQCKVKSFDKLNPNNNAHKGVLKLLEKYGIFKAPSEGLVSPTLGAQEKEKEKEEYKDINKVKKLDPYINPIKSFFLDEYKKVFGNVPMLSNSDCNRIVELAADNQNIKELIPIAIARLKCINFGDIGFKPTANWLLKENNFERVINGEFGKKTPYKPPERKTETLPDDERATPEEIRQISEKYSFYKHIKTG